MAAGGAAGGAASAAAAVAQATKASGIFVQVEPRDFQELLYRSERPMLVVTQVGTFRRKFQYLLSHRGFVFSTKTETQLHLPAGAEVVYAAKVWIPG